MGRKDRRAKLSRMLHEIGGTKVHVYYEPPESKKLDFPAIVYTRMRVNTVKADNRKYLMYDRFQVTYIHKDIDDEVADEILSLPYCEQDDEFTKNDMHHDIFTIFIP